jgi:hypothetical protein
MNILPREGSFGQTLGAGLGNVLGSGLQALAEHKMQQIAQGKLQNALSGLGIQNPQQVSQMPLEALKPLIEARSKNLYPQFKQPAPGVLGAIGGINAPEQFSGGPDGWVNIGATPEEAQWLSHQTPAIQAKAFSLYTNAPQAVGQLQPAINPAAKNIPLKQPASVQTNQATPQSVSPAEQVPIVTPKPSPGLKGAIGGAQAAKTAEEERKFGRGLEKLNKTAEIESQKVIDKDYNTYFDAIKDRKNAEWEMDTTVRRMLHLDETEPVTDSKVLNLMHRVGLDTIGGWTTPATEEAMALKNVFMKGLKGVLGSQFTAQEMTTYLSGVPGLMNTPEGRKRLARNISLQARLAQTDVNNAKKFRQENKKAIPRDWREQLDTMHDIAQKKYALEFALPPEQYKGNTYDDDDKGEAWQSNGKEWIQVPYVTSSR